MRKLFLKHSLFKFQSIEHRWSQAYSNQIFLSQSRSVKQQLQSIENLEKLDFWKTEQFYAKTTRNTIFSTFLFKSLKVFKKHLNSTQIFQKQYFQPFCSQNSNIKHNSHQNQGTYNFEWPKHIHTQFHILSLVKNNLCSVCN